MSQQEILEVIKKEPGIEQQVMHTKIDGHKSLISEQVRALERKHEIRRVFIKRTWKLYPAEAV